MDCPRCTKPFETTFEGLFEDILVRRCSGCAVLWMPAPSLDRLDDNINVDASRIAWREASDAGVLACPECVGSYRAAPPVLVEVALPPRSDKPSIQAYRCDQCRGFLIDEPTLERLRGYVAAM